MFMIMKMFLDDLVESEFLGYHWPGILWLFGCLTILLLATLAQCGNLRGHLILLQELFQDNQLALRAFLFKACNLMLWRHNLWINSGWGLHQDHMAAQGHLNPWDLPLSMDQDIKDKDLLYNTSIIKDAIAVCRTNNRCWDLFLPALLRHWDLALALSKQDIKEQPGPPFLQHNHFQLQWPNKDYNNINWMPLPTHWDQLRVHNLHLHLHLLRFHVSRPSQTNPTNTSKNHASRTPCPFLPVNLLKVLKLLQVIQLFKFLNFLKAPWSSKCSRSSSWPRSSSCSRPSSSPSSSRSSKSSRSYEYTISFHSSWSSSSPSSSTCSRSCSSWPLPASCTSGTRCSNPTYKPVTTWPTDFGTTPGCNLWKRHGVYGGVIEIGTDSYYIGIFHYHGTFSHFDFTKTIHSSATYSTISHTSESKTTYTTNWSFSTRTTIQK